MTYCTTNDNPRTTTIIDHVMTSFILICFSNETPVITLCHNNLLYHSTHNCLSKSLGKDDENSHIYVYHFLHIYIH